MRHYISHKPSRIIMSENNISSLTSTPYDIEAAPIDERYARGWHCLGLASDYTEKPQMLSYFGTKLVAYRGQDDNEVHILNAYCPHMGGDLSRGCVSGNSVVCPFHSWSWGADGVCDDIPYAKRIPPKAVIKSWPSVERNQLLFVWNDPEGNAPIESQLPARIDDCYSDEWTDWKIELMHIDINARELVDNMADVAHFGPVHQAPCDKFKNIVDKHTYTQQFWGSSAILAEDDALFSEAKYEGPAYMHTYMTGKQGGQEMESRLLVSHVPTSTNSFDLRFGVMVKKTPGLSDEENQKVCQSYVDANSYAFGQDVDIWHTKCRVDNPILCDGDGPVNKLRQWYAQFYMDVEQVGGAFDQVKEYETRINKK